MYVDQQRVRRHCNRERQSKAGKVKITVSGAEIKGEGSDLEGAFTFTGTRPPAPPPGGPRTLKFEPTVFHNYFAWNIAPALHIFPGDTVETKSVDARRHR